MMNHFSDALFEDLYVRNILETLETKTVRRDNDADFSPFGYKVDFYDGEEHIGEGSVCGIKDNEAFLYDFEVYPKFRGKGYSKEMLQYMIDNYDLKQLYVDQDNTIAINLYKKFGFTIDDEVEDNSKPAYSMVRK
jgi:ribosomal protein S18 acetylase RimI-like enzyme